MVSIHPRAAVTSCLVALGGSCAHLASPAAVEPLGEWRVVTALQPGGLRAGTLLSVTRSELAVFDSQDEWARMEVEWEPPAPAALRGRLSGSGERVELVVHGAELEVHQDGRQLAVAARLDAHEASVFRERLLTLPTVVRYRERLDDCIEQLETAVPSAAERLDDVHLETLFNTASFAGLSRVVLDLYASACLPPPEVCREPGLQVPPPASGCTGTN